VLLYLLKIITVFILLSHNTVTDLLKALRNSGHAVPQQEDATVLWKNFLRTAHAQVTSVAIEQW
jgi:hypothetical protein